MDELEKFMKQTDSALIVGARQMFFEDSEWVVTSLPRYGAKRQVLDRFLDTAPGSLAAALKLLASDEPW